MPCSVNDYKDTYLSGNLDKDITLFKTIFARDAVLRTREVLIGGSARCYLIFMDGMINSAQQGETVVEALVESSLPQNFVPSAKYIARNILFANEVTETEKLPDMLRAILYGDTVLIIESSKLALTINTKGWRTRGISEPSGERVLQGPREGFDEAAMFNLAMIRRKLLTPDLCIELMRIGRRSDTLVFICYLGSLANPDTVKELKKRLLKIDVDGILDSNYIAEHIRDAADGNFETLYITHADCQEDAEALRDIILGIAPFKNVVMGTIGPIVGASVGPGTLIAFCFGKEVMIEGNE